MPLRCEQEEPSKTNEDESNSREDLPFLQAMTVMMAVGGERSLPLSEVWCVMKLIDLQKLFQGPAFVCVEVSNQEALLLRILSVLLKGSSSHHYRSFLNFQKLLQGPCFICIKVANEEALLLLLFVHCWAVGLAGTSVVPNAYLLGKEEKRAHFSPLFFLFLFFGVGTGQKKRKPG